MSLGDAGENKDIRQRANDFLEHGVLGCCPEIKAAIGKTIAEANAPKQPEKALPNVQSNGGKRFDPKGKWSAGKELILFPTVASMNDLSGQPNFGWSDLPPIRSMSDAVDEMRKQPRIVQEVYEVDKDGNPTKKVSGPDDEDEEGENLKGKALGRTLREMNPGNTLVARAAKKFGVWVDAGGKFRCPPGTPQANQFTDDMGTTCFATSAREIANAAQEGFASLSTWWSKRQQRNMPFFIDEWGNVTENIDIMEGRQDYARVFTGARSRVRKRIAELEVNVDDLLRIHKIPPMDDNKDLVELLKILTDGKTVLNINGVEEYDNLSPRDKAFLKSEGITREAIVSSERGFLLKLAELALTDPERLKNITEISYADRGGLKINQLEEARAIPVNLDGKIGDIGYRIEYNPLAMARNVVSQIEEVKENQRLGLRVEGASSESEAASLLHEFVINEQQWAGGMTASLGKDKFLAKGVHTAIHEIAHTIQIDKFKEVAIEKYGASASIRDVTNEGIMNLMVQTGDGIDLGDLGLVSSDLEKIAFLGGRYGADEWKRSGLDDELWKIETTAELYALREMGVIDGDDVDGVLEWMDSTGATRSAEMRSAAKKKNKKVIEKREAARQLRPDGRADTPDAPAPKKPRKARVVKTATAADRIGKTLRASLDVKLEKDEIEAIERIGDPRTHQVISLAHPDEISLAVLSIDSNHKKARKNGVDFDEVDVTGSKAVERVAYDPKRERLYVTYEGGKSYYYRRVQPETVLELHKAETKGKAINEIKKSHDYVPVSMIPEKLDKKSLDDADIASQIQFNLIPTLTAIDKSEVGTPMRIVVPVDTSASSGESIRVNGITSARIYHDEMSVGDNELVVTIPADARGIPFEASVFDKSDTGSKTMMMVPPMRVAVLDDKNGRRGELIHQDSADTTLERIIEDWPTGSDAKENRTMSMAKRKAEEVIASHLAMGEGKNELADGSTAPIATRRIRTRNADIHARQTKRGSSPTKPTSTYRNTVSTQGLGSMGRIETQEERNFGRMSAHSNIVSDMRTDASIDPEIQRLIGGMDDRDISQMIDSMAIEFHEGVDRKPRLRVSNDELDKIISDGGRYYKNEDHFSTMEKKYQALIGIHPDTDEIDRPVSGYVVHPAQDLAARNEMRRRGVQVGDGPIEWPNGSNPHGDIGADGDIEVVLKPEVSGRTAYGFGYGIDEKTRPVWLNSSDHAAISDAIVHVDPATDPDGSRTRVLNSLSAVVDGDFGYLTDTGSVKPAATSQNERTEDFGKRVANHKKASKPQRLGAQIMGGFVNEEISEVRYPWSKVSSSSSDVDISDVVNKEPISDRLRRLGFTDAEIEYFYKVNGNRSLDYISSSTMASLKEYRKALEIKKDYEKRGIPNVSFMHPAGLDPLDVSSYSDKPVGKTTIENALAKAINAQVDEMLEKMLKQVRNTRGKIWEMKPKVGART